MPTATGDIREIVGQPVFVPLYRLFVVYGKVRNGEGERGGWGGSGVLSLCACRRHDAAALLPGCEAAFSSAGVAGRGVPARRWRERERRALVPLNPSPVHAHECGRRNGRGPSSARKGGLALSLTIPSERARALSAPRTLRGAHNWPPEGESRHPFHFILAEHMSAFKPLLIYLFLFHSRYSASRSAPSPLSSSPTLT